MTKINLEYFGMPGSGQTVKEAKLDAGKRITEALEGSYAPIVLNYRGKRANDGFMLGAWHVQFTGRTERDAILEGELARLSDLTKQRAA